MDGWEETRINPTTLTGSRHTYRPVTPLSLSPPLLMMKPENSGKDKKGRRKNTTRIHGPAMSATTTPLLPLSQYQFFCTCQRLTGRGRMG